MRASPIASLTLAVLGLCCAGALWLAGRFVVLSPSAASALLIATTALGLSTLVVAALQRGTARLRAATAVVGLLVLAAAALFPVVLLRAAPRDLLRFDAAPESAQSGSTLGDASEESPARLRIAQLNVWRDYPRLSRLTERADDLATLLREAQPDVVVLDSVWHVAGSEHLAQMLGDRLGLHAVYARTNGSRRWLGIEEGSAILSRFPVAEAERTLLEPVPSPFDRTVALRAEIEVPGHGRLGVVGTNLHHHDRQIAVEQARSLLSRLEAAPSETPTVLVAGAFDLEAEDPVFGGYRDAGNRDPGANALDRLLIGANAGWRTVWSESRALPLRGVWNGAPLGPNVALDSLSDHELRLAEIEPLEPRSTWPGRWTSAAPEDLGFDGERLAAAVETIGELDGLECLLVARYGKLAIERYFRGADARRLRNVKSVSKSVLSAVVGIAIEEGHVALDDRLGDWLPAPMFDGDARKASITVADLLTMRSGLESTSFGNYGAWTLSRDWVANALARPLLEAPGERMRYSTGDTHLLSAVLTAATGTSTLSFAEEHLFRPLGIERVVWQRSPQGIYVGGNNLSMTARDMARFGQLYLDRGRWGERQIVPWRWVDASTRPVAETRWGGGGGYGYLWWIRPGAERGAYTANGFGGQYIYVSPAHELVVVIGATETSKGREWRWELFDQIVGGIVGNVSFPGQVRLASQADESSRRRTSRRRTAIYGTRLPADQRPPSVARSSSSKLP